MGSIRIVGGLFFSVQLGVRSRREEVKDRYEKSEHMVLMRDGVRLHTTVYAPRNHGKTYPFLIERTPYGSHPYGKGDYPESLGPSQYFADSGYIFVQQDVRGCFLSEGRFQDLRPYLPNKPSKTDIDESSDAYDTIDWLVKNIPNHNGKAGLWGISYPGFYATQSLIDGHPALAAVSPQAPVTDWFLGDDSHHNGAFFLLQEFNFDASFDVPRPGPPLDRRRSSTTVRTTPMHSSWTWGRSPKLESAI